MQPFLFNIYAIGAGITAAAGRIFLYRSLCRRKDVSLSSTPLSLSLSRSSPRKQREDTERERERERVCRRQARLGRHHPLTPFITGISSHDQPTLGYFVKQHSITKHPYGGTSTFLKPRRRHHMTVSHGGTMPHHF